MPGSRIGLKILILALTALLIIIAAIILAGAYTEYIVPIMEKVFPAAKEPQDPACRQCLDRCNDRIFQRDVCRHVCYDNQICSA